MRRALKIIAWSLGTLVLIIGLACIGAVIFLHSSYLRSMAETQASAYSGRKTQLGHIGLDWDQATKAIHVRLDDVQIANADWTKSDHMFKADTVEFDLLAKPLLHGDLVFPQVHLQKPDIDLEQNDKDENNWTPAQSPVAGAAVEQAAPQQRSETPLIGQLVIDDGHIAYHDAKRKLDIAGTIQTAQGQAGGQPQAKLDLKGSIEKKPLALHFTGGSILMLRDTDKPYPIDLDVTYADTHLTTKGTVDDPFQFKGADIRLTLQGSNLANIYPLLGIPGPPTPPYKIAGKLNHEPGMWHITNMTMHAGDSDLSGQIDLDQHSKPTLLKANLVSDHLAFADLAPLVGAAPGRTTNVSSEQKKTEQKLEANGELFPNVPLHTEHLRAMNMDVTLDARHVVAPNYLPVTAINARVQVNNGQAQVQPLKIALGSGTVSGQLGIDARSDVPPVTAKLDLQNIELATFFRGSRFFDTTKGRIQGRVDLTGNGKSLAQVMGTARGTIAVGMTDGSVSNLMVSLAGLEIIDALVVYVTGDNQIPIRCALGQLAFDKGVVSFKDTLMDTRRSVLHFDGQANLGTQAVNSKITADPKKFDVLDLHGPIMVEGKLRSPDVHLGRMIPIPTPDFGGAKDVDCDARIRDVLAFKAQGQIPAPSQAPSPQPKPQMHSELQTGGTTP
ncbi:MAG TPA: AsmA family protein [Magnetospirillaceae bacterium]